MKEYREKADLGRGEIDHAEQGRDAQAHQRAEDEGHPGQENAADQGDGDGEREWEFPQEPLLQDIVECRGQRPDIG